MIRAAHQLYDGEPKILVDQPILRMLGPETLELIAGYKDRLREPFSIGLRTHIVLRSRFAEDRLADAFARGVRQFVTLGAGNDTFAYRQPEWASALHIVEVDHPASQAVKRAQLSGAGIDIPSNVTFAPIDFETTTLADGLRAGGVDLDQPAFFSWLGVTMYLTEAAIDAVLQTIVKFPASSEIVFTFARPRSPQDDASWDSPVLAERAAALGEPWLTYFEPDPLEAKLRAFGFSDVYFLTPDEARRRYFEGRTDGLSAPRRTTIVSATV